MLTITVCCYYDGWGQSCLSECSAEIGKGSYLVARLIVISRTGDSGGFLLCSCALRVYVHILSALLYNLSNVNGLELP